MNIIIFTSLHAFYEDVYDNCIAFQNGYPSRRRSLVDDARFESAVVKQTKQAVLDEARLKANGEFYVKNSSRAVSFFLSSECMSWKGGNLIHFLFSSCFYLLSRQTIWCIRNKRLFQGNVNLKVQWYPTAFLAPDDVSVSI